MKIKDAAILHASILCICLLLNMTYGVLGWLGIALISYIIGLQYKVEMDSNSEKDK